MTHTCESTGKCPLAVVVKMGVIGREESYRYVCSRHISPMRKALFLAYGRGTRILMTKEES
jgi:hypothetical protein